jgi:PKD repeat protein
VAPAANPVDLQIGPKGDLFYVDFSGGTIRRIEYSGAPTARATASPTSGAVPLMVNFDGSGSSDPSGSSLSYAWDLDGDGAYDDSTAAQPSYTYTTAGDYNVGLRVTNNQGASDTLDQPLVVSVGSTPPPTNTPPVATIEAPAVGTTWTVGQTISFSGSATDQQDGALTASDLDWTLILHHCPSNCHSHSLQGFTGVAEGSFDAPDHEYPSYLE